jgi:hypothetical protein
MDRMGATMDVTGCRPGCGWRLGPREAASDRLMMGDIRGLGYLVLAQTGGGMLMCVDRYGAAVTCLACKSVLPMWKVDGGLDRTL